MHALTLHVAPDGSDQFDGSCPEPDGKAGPLASLTRAFELLRQRKARGAVPASVTISLRGGTYTLDRPIVIRPEQCVPVTIQPYEQEHPVISGGRVLSGWTEAVHRGQRAWTLTLDDVAAGRWHFRSLYVNNERRERPRLPKKGLYRIAHVPGMPVPTGWTSEGYDRFSLAKGDMKSFSNLTDVEVVAFHFWICERLPVQSFDPETELITTRIKSRAPLVEAWGKDLAPCYLDNVRDALGDPGEWYLSRQDGKLTYLPLAHETLENTTIVAPKALQLLKLIGRPEKQETVEWLTFRDIEFRHTDWAQPNEPHVDQDTAWYDSTRTIHRYGRRDRGSASQADCDISGAIFLTGARNCTFEGCTIANTGWYGVDIGDGCQAIALHGCELTDLGGGGVKLNGSAHAEHAPLLETGNNRITDCHIHHGGRVFCASVGIHCMHSYGNHFCHNDIHHLFYSGVSVGWQWGFKPSICRDNQIAFNHIHNLGGGMLSDMGGVYTLGIQNGTAIRNNLIHDIQASHYGAWCIYPDEGSSHLVIENNICHSTNREIFHQHYGRENIVCNNIFAFGERAVITYSCFVAPDLGFRLYRNILLAHSEPHFLGGYAVGLDTHGHESNFNLLHRYDGHEPVFATKSGTTENASDSIPLTQWQQNGHDRQSIATDPLCTDAGALDFTLAPDSPAITQLGFRPIDASGIGPRPRSHWNDYQAPHPRALQ